MTQRILSLLCILILFIGCVPEKNDKAAVPGTGDAPAIAPAATPADTPQRDNGNSVTIFLTGDTLGQLEPCGCAAGQLGGFSRRSAILDKVPRDKRLIIDAGNFIADQSEQSLLKFDSMIQSLSILGYDLINLNELDMQVVSERYPLEAMPLQVISSFNETENVRNTYNKKFQIDSNDLLVTVTSALAGSLDLDRIQNQLILEPDAAKINILIIDNCDESTIDFLAESQIFDIVICPFSNDEPQVIKTNYTAPLFVSVGKLGKYIGKLDITFSANEKPKLNYSAIRVDERLPAEPVLEDVYKNYQNMLREDDILGKVARVPLPEGLEYVGSDKCEACHPDEYTRWSTQKHAHAYQTLVDIGSQYDPECIDCHVIGLKFESGFENEKSPKDLRNVGCEVCHGPRSKHIKNPLKDADNHEKAEPIAAFDCISCHSPEHSPGFQSDEVGYRKKNIHWTEPKNN